MKILGIIVCRKDSRRLPDKTWKSFQGKSLLENKISQLSRVPSLDGLVVGSNCERVSKFCKDNNVNFVPREDYYCDETKCTANEMIKDMLSKVDCDVILWAHLTNPFITAEHYEEAIQLYKSQKKDSVFSVSEIKTHLWNSQQQPINHDPWSTNHTVAADLEPYYKQNGGIFIRSKIDMESDGRFIGDNPYMYVMSEQAGWDIDEQWQLGFAQGHNE